MSRKHICNTTYIDEDIRVSALVFRFDYSSFEYLKIDQNAKLYFHPELSWFIVWQNVYYIIVRVQFQSSVK